MFGDKPVLELLMLPLLEQNTENECSQFVFPFFLCVLHRFSYLVFEKTPLGRIRCSVDLPVFCVIYVAIGLTCKVETGLKN